MMCIDDNFKRKAVSLDVVNSIGGLRVVRELDVLIALHDRHETVFDDDRM